MQSLYTVQKNAKLFKMTLDNTFPYKYSVIVTIRDVYWCLKKPEITQLHAKSKKVDYNIYVAPLVFPSWSNNGNVYRHEPRSNSSGIWHNNK